MRTVQFAVLLMALFILGSVVSIPMAHAAAITWTGAAGDGKWETAGNWDLGLPGAADNVFILAGAFVVTVSTTQTVGDIAVGFGDTLVCQSTCALTATNYDSSGTFKNFGTFTVATLEVGGTAAFFNFGTVIITTAGQFAFDVAGTFINECGGTVNETPTMVSGTFTTLACPVGGVVTTVNTFSVLAPWMAVLGVVGCIGTIVVVAKKRRA